MTANSSANTASRLYDTEIQLSFADSIEPDLIERYYAQAKLTSILTTTLDYMDQHALSEKTYPYFSQLPPALWQAQAKELALYITEPQEGRQLNRESRDKDYATNILSYPSDLPDFLLEELPSLPLGELVICHQVVEQQAIEQGKTLADHISHLLVHGILHLLGFDHELGQAEQDEMEGLEIAILAKLGIANPYLPPAL